MIPSHPYRTCAPRPHAPAPNAGAQDRRELVVPFVLVWLLSVVHVLSLVASGATFGAGDTVALAMLVLLPWLLFGGR